MKSSQLAFGAFYRPDTAPISGRTAESWAASASGAAAVDPVRSRNIQVIRELWRTPSTLNDIAERTGLPLTSVCSLKSGIESELVWDSYESVPGGPGRKATKRSRWVLRPIVPGAHTKPGRTT